MPNTGLYKHHLTLPGDTGKPDGAITAKNESLEVWGLDERGSFNAVCGFLHKLGARWFLPGELGELLSAIKTIPLPKLDEKPHTQWGPLKSQECGLSPFFQAVSFHVAVGCASSRRICGSRDGRNYVESPATAFHNATG